VTRRLRLLVALVALPLAWLVSPGAVPLYDGISTPDEPYRYVVAPAGAHGTPKPLSAKGTVDVAEGSNAATIYVSTGEFAPQVAIVLPGRLVAVSGSAGTVTVSVAPLAPDRQPSKGTIDGNVYRVTASAGATWAPPPGDAVTEAQITMRATSARRPIPSFLHRSAPTQPWTALHTFISGNDVYSAQFAGFGDYALAFGVAPTVSHSHTAAYLLSGLLVLVLLAAGTIVAVRLSRRHQDGSSPP
jgi:hypothetical protein